MTLKLLDVERMAATEPPPVPWLVDPLLIRSHVTMLAGREGTGKSLLALALAASGGNGVSVGGMEAAGPLRTLYVDAENGEGEVHRRVRALGAVPKGLAYAHADGFDLRAHIANLDALVAEQKPDVLVLDSLRSLTPTLDENDSGSAEVTIAPLKKLARARQCAVLVLHHAGKGEGGQGYRGSSGLGAAIEAGFTLGRLDDDPERRTRRRLSCWKMRPASEPPTLWLSLEADEGRITIAEAEPFTPSGASVSAVDSMAQEIGRMVAEHGEMPRAAICDELGRDSRDGTVGRALTAAVDAGLVKKARHGRYAPASSQVAEVANTGLAKYPASQTPSGAGWLDTSDGVA